VNSPIRKVAAAVAVLFIAMFVNLNYVQVVKGSSYRDNPDNPRVLLAEYSSPRGQIVVQGSPIAQSVATNDALKYLRQYPHGPLYAPVTGFYSFIYGSSELESAVNSVLVGNDPRLFGRQLADILTGRDPRGGSVVLTLNKAAQVAAYNGMRLPDGSFKAGAVVALDPSNGAILAAVSTPSYDPSLLSSHDADKITAAWHRLLKDPSQPMLNRAFNQLYPSGSVFKVIDSAAALKMGYTPNTVVPAPNAYWPLGGSGPCPASHAAACIENFGGEQCENGKTATLGFAFAKSCNTAFAQLAVEKIGGEALATEASKFGFDTGGLSVPVPVAPSTIGTAEDLADKAALAQTAIGQRDVRMTPLQGAMIAAAVANDGQLVTPYLVQQERGPNLSVIQGPPTPQVSTVLDPTLDQSLQQMMEGVVSAPEGTGGAAAITDIPGVVVGGKTGTADTGVTGTNGQPTPPHAWFCGFALQNGLPKIAVAVLVENGGVNGSETTGGQAAAPIAKEVMEAYLRSIAGSPTGH
jgi:peptidoglycan glycosyltransferase